MNTAALIFGLTFGISGLIMYFFPAKKPNAIYGYRTERSMSNIHNWKIAQRYSAQWFLLIAFGSFVIGLINIAEDIQSQISIGWTILGVVLTIFFTEKKLKEISKH
jgi:uncharacterized membrane protein